MRFLFVAPIATGTFLNALGKVAAQLQEMGHSIHFLIRQNSRVVHNGQVVLSRNRVNIERYLASIGDGNLSFLYSDLGLRPHSAHKLLIDADVDTANVFIDNYRPDALIVCEDVFGLCRDLLDRTNLAMRQTAAMLLTEVDKGHATLRGGVGSRVVDLNDQADLKSGLVDVLISKLDPVLSRRAVADVLREVEKVDASTKTPARSNAARALRKTRGHVSVSRTQGAIQSFSDNDVLFGDFIPFRGWIDLSHPDLKAIVVHVNDAEHRCFPNLIRGDLIEQYSHYGLLGFDCRIPIGDAGSRLKLRINLLTKDGEQHAWKKAFLWANDSTPAVYINPIVSGAACMEVLSDGLRVSGRVCVEGLKVKVVRVYQAGLLFSEHQAEFASGGYCEFEMERVSAVVDQPLHLWVEPEGLPEQFWLRLDPVGVSAESTTIFSQPTFGQLIADEVVSVSGHVPGRQVSLTLNGKPLKTLYTQAGEFQVEVACDNWPNSAYLEAFGESGEYDGLQLWRHVSADSAQARGRLVSVPPRSVIAAPVLESPSPPHVLLIRKGPFPTDELYVLAPIKRMLEAGEVILTTVDTMDEEESGRAELDKLLPGMHVIVSRYISQPWLERISVMKEQLGKVFYLMDDDVLSAADSKWMPGGYRKRMMGVAYGEFQTMLNMCDRFLVTSRFLQRRFSGDKTDLLEPPYLDRPRSLKHLDSDRKIVISYHGTSVHRDDLLAIAPALKYVHDKYSNVRIQIVMGGYVPNILKGLPRFEDVPSMDWDDYKKFRVSAHAHIAIAPMLDTPYNRGKSFIKLFDISALGAAGVYTDCPPFNEVVSHGENGLLLQNDPLAWQQSLSWLIENPPEIRRLAQAGQELAERVGNISRLEGYWQGQLGIEV